LTERALNKKDFETRLTQMIVQFDKIEIMKKITDLAKKIRSLIIIKKMLYFLTDPKVNVSLNKIKLEIIEIENCYNNNLLSEDILKKAFDTCVNTEKDLEFRLKSEIQKIISLIKSWERINNTFGCKNISKGELLNFQNEFRSLMSIGGLLNSNEEISEMTVEYEKKINNFKKQKQNYYDKIIEYLS